MRFSIGFSGIFVGLYRQCLICAVLLSAASIAAVSAQDPQLRFGSDVPREVEQIYERGLKWLAANQSAEGGWDGGDNGPGVTGMCVMAFLASGEDPNFGPYREQIRRAVRSIILSQSGETGFYAVNMGHGSMYHHGFACLAMSEVYGVLDESTLWAGAESAAAAAGPAVVQGQRRSVG
ncbi:MAG: squalene--hopene cyclase, partial [Planctomycetaceae bacterium]